VTVVETTPRVSVLMVVCAEPIERLQRAVDAVARQEGIRSIELLIAAPRDEHDRLGNLRPHGAVTTITLVHSPGGSRTRGLNAALREARGSVVARVDARSLPPPDYLARCVMRLEHDPTVGVVGAIQRPQSGSDGIVARGVARALRNPYFLGGARYRRTDGGGPADTAYLGAFRREQLVQLGGFDERLSANEDFDVCARYRDRGARVWVEPGLEVEYEARTTFAGVWRQFQAFGDAKVDYWRRSRTGPNGRQAVALLAGGVAVAGLGSALRRPARAAALVAGAVGALTIVDHVVDPSERDVRVRAVAVGTAATLGAAWCCGVARGVSRLCGRRGATR
jgi:GT2 family glycosyltransferase